MQNYEGALWGEKIPVPDLGLNRFSCRLLLKVSSDCTLQPSDILQDNKLSSGYKNNSFQQLHSLLAFLSIIEDFTTNVISWSEV